MLSEWMTHKGKKIFFCKFSNLTYAELAAEVEATDTAISQQPANSVLVLTDISNVIGSPQVVSLFKNSTNRTKNYVHKSAAVGIGFSGPKKVLFDIVMKFSGQNVVVFNDVESAKDWLIQGE